MSLTESKIEARVVKYCRDKGLYTRKFSSPAHRGVPDRIILGCGRVLFLELKRPGGKLTSLQIRELDLIRAHGLHAKSADSYEEAKRIIDDLFCLFRHENI